MKKYRVLTGMIVLLLLLPPVQVQAESGDGFRLDSLGNIILDSSHAAKEGISSLSFSLTVEPEEASSVEFLFEGSSAEILEYRYRADEKKMNIYIAGTSPLFAEGTESLSVGRVVISGENGQSGVATVGVESGSLKFVYGSELRPMEGVEIPEKVKIGAPEPLQPTQTPPPPTQTPEPAQPTQTPVPAQPTQAPSAPSAGSNVQPPILPTETPIAAVPTIIPQHPAASHATPKPTAHPEESESSSGQNESIYGITPIPLETESPELGASEETFVVVSLETEAEGENESKQDSPFLENIKLIVTGFAIASALSGTGAAVIAFLIKKPWR